MKYDRERHMKKKLKELMWKWQSEIHEEETKRIYVKMTVRDTWRRN